MKKWRCSFSVEGLNIERFLRAADARGILLKDVCREHDKRLTATTTEDGILTLMEISAQGGWEFTKGSRMGFGRMIDVLHRRRLMAGVFLLCAITVFIATRFVWRVEIVDAGVYTADVYATLNEIGLRTPMLRRHIDLAEIQAALQWRYPRTAWVECGWRGTTLVIRLIEGHIMPDSLTHASGSDVTALRDGIVKSIVTAAGTPVVAPGDVVKKGQVLIKGEERTSNGEYRPVSAEGCVMARVWDNVQVQTCIYGISTEYTGRRQQVKTIVSPWFSLWPVDKPVYEQQDIAVSSVPLGGFFVPLSIRTETRYECVLKREMMDFDKLIAEGNAAATRKLLQLVDEKESFVDIWVNWSIIDNEILLSEAVGERLMDIAQQESCSGMAATE